MTTWRESRRARDAPLRGAPRASRNRQASKGEFMARSSSGGKPRIAGEGLSARLRRTVLALAWSCGLLAGLGLGGTAGRGAGPGAIPHARGDRRVRTEAAGRARRPGRHRRPGEVLRAAEAADDPAARRRPAAPGPAGPAHGGTRARAGPPGGGIQGLRDDPQRRAGQDGPAAERTRRPATPQALPGARPGQLQGRVVDDQRRVRPGLWPGPPDRTVPSTTSRRSPTPSAASTPPRRTRTRRKDATAPASRTTTPPWPTPARPRPRSRPPKPRSAACKAALSALETNAHDSKLLLDEFDNALDEARQVDTTDGRGGRRAPSEPGRPRRRGHPALERPSKQANDTLTERQLRSCI